MIKKESISNVAIPDEIKLENHIYDYLNRHGFSEGNDVLPEEMKFCRMEAERLVKFIGIIDDIWEPVIFECDIPYVSFKNIKTGEITEYYDMDLRIKREIDRKVSLINR